MHEPRYQHRTAVLDSAVVWGPVVLLWGGLLWRLRQEWEWSETYSFGFVVPLLVAVLVARRWGDDQIGRARGAMIRAGILAGLAVFPCELLIRANPDWRVSFWFYGVIALAGSTLWLSAVGGRRWALHFMPAIVLLFLAIPWPTVIERPIIQGLSGFIALASAEVANLFGTPAVHLGNTIALEGGARLGVEDACSGLRSFQAALMTAWFLGELMRLRWAWRVILLGIGCALAVLFNCLRTVLLIWAASSGKERDAFDAFHDGIGAATAIASFVTLTLIAMAKARSIRRAPAGGAASSREDEARPTVPAGVPVRAFSSFIGAWAITICLASSWFRQAPTAATARIQLDWNTLEPAVSFVEIDSGTRELLRYSNARHAVWEPEVGIRCDVFLFDWEAGQISSFADVHHPEVCLPASGIDLTNTGEWSPDHSGTVFDTWSAKGMNVFFSVWDCGAAAAGPRSGLQSMERIAKAFRGESITARQSLEILVTGTDDAATARSFVRQLMVASVRSAEAP